MDSKLEKYLDNTDSFVKQEFLENNNSKLKVDTSYHKVEYDYSWLEKAEETVEYLDAIVRDPKRFIEKEEEIVPVEKAKKVTEESIKHLATHTYLIQEFDEKRGTITPSKVLNINKEESFDMYENRFIYSLLMNLQMFIARRKELTKEGSNCRVNKLINYSASTKVGKEKINIDINLTSDYYEDLVGKDPKGLGLEERVERIQFIIADFLKSQFIKELVSSNVTMVKSPIRKTNVILKNPNFQKALELWEFIEQYNVTDKVEENENKKYEDESIFRDTFDEAFLLNYLIMSNDSKPSKSIKKYYIRKIIKDFIENNDKYDEKSFKKLINNEFKSIYQDKLKREKEITKIFNKEIERFNASNAKALEFLV